MNKVLGNNCSKGCLIYIVALVALLMVAAMGLDGLRARFGGAQVQGNKPPEYTIQSTNNVPPASNPADGGGDPGPTPTVASAPPPPVTSPQPVGTPAPSQGQGGTIQGDAGSSFYIIQPGDTLWSISMRFGVSIDDLRALNNLSSDIIYPGQVLYIPTAQTQALPPAATPASPPTGAGNDPGELPSMPNTGIIKKP